MKKMYDFRMRLIQKHGNISIWCLTFSGAHSSNFIQGYDYRQTIEIILNTMKINFNIF